MEKELTSKIVISKLEAAYNDKYDSRMAAHGILKELLKEGNSSEHIKKILTEYMLALRNEGDEEKEGFVMDCLDFLAGWCSPNLDLSNG